MTDKRTDWDLLLTAADEELRLQGLKGLAGRCDEWALHQLYTALGDVSWRVRKEAVELFFGLPAPGRFSAEVAELLHAHDNAGLRNAAVEILTRMGSEAVPSLLEELSCADPDVRKFALDILGAIGAPDAVGVMLRILDDSDANVRAAAAENLGKLRCDGAIPALVAALEGADLLLCFTILEALGQIGGKVPVARLLPLVKKPLLSQALFDCLGRVGGGESLPLLVTGLSDTMSNVREAAALALARLTAKDPTLRSAFIAQAGEAQADALVELLASPQQQVRKAAVVLLGGCARPRHAARLLDIFAEEPLRESALQALANADRPTRCALAGLWPELDSRRRCYVTSVIAAAGCRKGQPLLLEALAAADPDLRLSAVRALGAVGDAAALQPLVGALRAPDQELRAAAVTALGRLAEADSEQLLGALRPLLNDPDAEIRAAAVSLLGQLSGAHLGALLDFALKDESCLVRRAAVRALEAQGGAEQAASLQLALTDEDVGVRRLAAEALATCVDPAAVEALVVAQRDADFWVRAAAVRSLGRSGGEKAAPLVEPALADPVGMVVIAALETLAATAADGGQDHALQALGHDDEEVVTAAIKLLAGRDSGDWLHHYGRELLNHPHWEVRIGCARALVARPEAAHRRLLEERLLIEGEGPVRQELQALLAAASGQE